MEQILLELEKLIPDGLKAFKRRYDLMLLIATHGPVGRRTLSTMTPYSERIIRSEIELLYQQSLLLVSPKGIMLTEEGQKLLSSLAAMYALLDQKSLLEEEIKSLLGLLGVVIVKGDSDFEEHGQTALARAGGVLLLDLLKNNQTITVTGGTTVAKVVSLLTSPKTASNEVTVLPARGSIGTNLEYHANTIAARLAQHLGCDYELLNIPDNLSRQSIESIKQEPSIQKTLQKMAKSDMIVYGLGNAIKMAKRRHERPEVIHMLEKEQAVTEAFRHYFNKNGEIVHTTQNIGMTLEMVRNIPIRIAIAGGSSKANAILATKELLKGGYLVLDEGAANQIVALSKI